MGYLGAKGGSGVYQAIINVMPPHDTYIEAFLGTGVVMKNKAPAMRNIGVDLNPGCVDGFDYAAELFQTDALNFLSEFDYHTNGRVLVYCDPPYLHETRTSRARYEHELSDKDHERLLNVLLSLPDNVSVILSGYRNALYDRVLSHWWSKDFQAMSRGGVRTETIWCNFFPSKVHFHTYAGKNNVDRQRIKRKAERWAKNFAALPAPEQQAVLSAILSIEQEETHQ